MNNGMTSQRQSTINDGIYHARSGDSGRAQRDRFARTCLTARGAKIYADAVDRYERTEDEDRLAMDVAAAVDAGY